MLRSAETTTVSPSTGQTGWCSVDECGKQVLTTPFHRRWALIKTDSAIGKPEARMKFKVILATVEKQRPSNSSSTVCRPESSHLYSIVNYQAFQGSSISEDTANLEGFPPRLDKLSSIWCHAYTPLQMPLSTAMIELDSVVVTLSALSYYEIQDQVPSPRYHFFGMIGSVAVSQAQEWRDCGRCDISQRH